MYHIAVVQDDYLKRKRQIYTNTSCIKNVYSGVFTVCGHHAGWMQPQPDGDILKTNLRSFMIERAPTLSRNAGMIDAPYRAIYGQNKRSACLSTTIIVVVMLIRLLILPAK